MSTKEIGRFVNEEIVRNTIETNGLDGSDRHVGVEQSLDILGRKNDVWESFQGWYDSLDDGAQRYMSLMLEAALIGLDSPESGLATAADYDHAARELVEQGRGLDSDGPEMLGPISTVITRELIKRTIRQNCATRWATCT
jgi:hypothetical protein